MGLEDKMKTNIPRTTIVSTRVGSSMHQAADSRVEGIEPVEWIEGGLYYVNTGIRYEGQRINNIAGAEAQGFEAIIDAEIAAMQSLFEHGRDNLNADAYELTGTLVSHDDENPRKWFGYATAIFYSEKKGI